MSPIPRRRFLQQGSAAVAAALVASFPRELWANPLGLPIGIQLYTVKDALQNDVAGTLKQLSTMGYKEVEAFHYSGYDPKSLRAALDATGLKCPSAHLSLDGPDLGPEFEGAHTLGAHYAVSSVLQLKDRKHSKGQPAPEMTLDDYKRLAAKMNQIGRKAKQAGLQYAYHNHDMEFRDLGDGKIGYDVLLIETDPELVNFELDCGWMAVAGYSPVEYFRKYPHRYKMLHIKQFVKGSPRTNATSGPTAPVGTELGRGKPDYKPIFATASRIGIQHYFIEQEPPFLDMTSLEAAKMDYDYLRAL